MATVLDIYRQVRASQWDGMYSGHHYVTSKSDPRWGGPARRALAVARDEIALRKAEYEDRIRFRWEYDDNIDAACDMDPPEAEAECRAKVESGEWEALGCIAEVPEKCPHCGQELEDRWTVADALWGIVIDVNDKYDYKREIERELADEAGVLNKTTIEPIASRKTRG